MSGMKKNGSTGPQALRKCDTVREGDEMTCTMLFKR